MASTLRTIDAPAFPSPRGRLRILLAAFATLTLAACSSDQSTTAITPILTSTSVPATTTFPTTAATTTTPATIDPAIGATMAAYSTWEAPQLVSIDDRNLVPQSWSETAEDGSKTSVACRPNTLPTLSRTFDQFPAFGFSGPLAPGLIVEGAGIEEGDLRVLPLERAPLTLLSSLASANPIQDIDRPDSTSLTGAVALLKRDADARLTGIDVVPSDIVYTRSESYSFEQSSLELDVSLRYDSPMRQAGLDSSFEQESETEKHSIAVKMIQPMYSIRMADDTIGNAGDFFTPSVQMTQIDTLTQTGELGPQNAPLLIDEVTYGRVMYFTMTSRSASSAQDLMVAIDGAQSSFSGEAELTTEQRQMLSTSEISMLSYGGDQNLALAAIRTGDLSQFFGAANTTTAAPLSFSMRTLNGDRVEVSDSADLQQVLCSRQGEAYSFSVEVSDVHGRVEVFVNGKRVIDAEHTPENILKTGTQYRRGSGSADISGSLQPGSNNTVEVKYGNTTCVDARFTLMIERDGQTIINQSMGPKCAFLFTWEYGIDTTIGTISDDNSY